MSEELTYEELAAHYDRIYDAKPYADEADAVVDQLADLGAEEGDRLLNVGCGTGRHDEHFSRLFDVTGVDVHAPVLAIAQERVPEARFVQADATELDLGEWFDALTSLFGVIGYLETREALEQAIARVAAHLEPGAPFVVEAWIPAHRFEAFEGVPVLRTYEDDEVTLARIAVPHREDESTARLEIEWMIARPGGAAIQRYRETQRMGIFDVERTLSLFDEHGLEATFDEEGLSEERGLIVGRKRGQGGGS